MQSGSFGPLIIWHTANFEITPQNVIILVFTAFHALMICTYLFVITSWIVFLVFVKAGNWPLSFWFLCTPLRPYYSQWVSMPLLSREECCQRQRLLRVPQGKLVPGEGPVYESSVFRKKPPLPGLGMHTVPRPPRRAWPKKAKVGGCCLGTPWWCSGTGVCYSEM